MLAVGTETDGSVVSPASHCGIVGIKPTIGLVSRSGIIPIAHSQDTAGPMCRTVADAAAEGARHASLLGSDAAAGVERTRELIATAIGPRYAERVSASSAVVAGLETIEIRVAAPLPVLGFIGPVALEVAGHAPVESLR
jgi:hypothetical protein